MQDYSEVATTSLVANLFDKNSAKDQVVPCVLLRLRIRYLLFLPINYSRDLGWFSVFYFIALLHCAHWRSMDVSLSFLLEFLDNLLYMMYYAAYLLPGTLESLKILWSTYAIMLFKAIRLVFLFWCSLDSLGGSLFRL